MSLIFFKMQIYVILNAAYTAGQKQEGRGKWEVQAQF